MFSTKIPQKMLKSFKFVVSSSFIPNVSIIKCCSPSFLRLLHNGNFRNHTEQEETVFCLSFCVLTIQAYSLIFEVQYRLFLKLVICLCVLLVSNYLYFILYYRKNSLIVLFQ